MRSTGYFFSGLGLQSGAMALMFYFFNMAIWSALAALLGSGLGIIGLGLIMWALYPVRRKRVPNPRRAAKVAPTADVLPA